MNLAETTCNLHHERAASARCPSCKLFFCPECITEHDGKLTCAECLRKEETEPEEVAGKWEAIQPMPLVHLLIAVFISWGAFYFIAQVLMDVPDSFHDGTIWQKEGGKKEETKSE